LSFDCCALFLELREVILSFLRTRRLLVVADVVDFDCMVCKI